MDDIRQEAVSIYEKKACNISITCKAVGISRATWYRWLKQFSDFAEAVSEVEESMIDNVETKLYSKIQEGDTTSLIFFLKTKGRSRGYIENPQLAIQLNNQKTVYEAEYHLQSQLDSKVVSTQTREKLLHLQKLL